MHECFLNEDVNEIKLFLRVFLTDKTGRHLNKGLIQNTRKYNKKKLFFMVSENIVHVYTRGGK